jgi:putative ABC transport system permease protein
VIEAGWTRLRRFWRPAVRTEIDDELAFHFAMRVEQLVAEGYSLPDAEHRARAMFGDVGQVTERLASIDRRRRSRLDFIDFAHGTATDVRHAMRSLRKQWIVTTLAVLTLAIGIGASTAIFSVVAGVLLQPLPYGHPEQLGYITPGPRNSVTDDLLSGPDLYNASRGKAFSGVAGVVTVHNVPFGLDGGAPEPLAYATVTPNFFDVLQIGIARGRNFTPDDGLPNEVSVRPPDDSSGPAVFRLPRVGMLSYRYWQRRFHGDPSVIGRSIVGPWGPMEIVGITGPRAELLFPDGLAVSRFPDVWEAARRDLAAMSPTGRAFHIVARVRPDVSIDAARAEVAALRPLARDSADALRFEQMQPYLVRDVRPALLTLLGAVLVVLLIACASVASLSLVRAAKRDRELAVRAAIGGSSWRIVRQLCAESVVIAIAAAGIGLVLAKFGIAALIRLAPGTIPRVDLVAIDARVFGFCILATAGSTLIFGLLPALRASRPRVVQALRVGAAGSGSLDRTALRNVVVIAEIALSLVLLVSCGLVMRSFATLMRADLGFNPNGVLTFTISNRNFRLAGDRTLFNQELRDRLAAVPGVQQVILATQLPFAGDANNEQYQKTQWSPATGSSSQISSAVYVAADSAYFSMLQTPIVAGHIFSANTPRDSIVIDETLAHRAFGDVSPLGRHLIVGVNRDTFTVIGVVRHQRLASMVGDEYGVIYLTWPALNPAGGRWAVRVSGDTSLIIPNLRAAIASVKSDYRSSTRAAGPGSTQLIVNGIEPLSRYTDRALAPTRFALVLIAIFAFVAVLLATIGIYSVVSTVARQRTSEIGIRLAFGADARDIFRLIVGHGMRLSMIGIAIGIAIALAGTRVLAGLLVNVPPDDPATFLVVALTFLGIAAAACWVPARRAASLDPTIALRDDG